MSRQKVAVYGSLRVGEYNYERFIEYYGQKAIKPEAQEIEITGFNLYNLGAYPAITEGDNKLVIDILSLSNEAYNSIKSMELGAGYDENTIEVPEHGEVKIYTFKKGSFPEERLVESGNWSQFLKN